MNHKQISLTEKDCFTVSIDYKNIDYLVEIAEQYNFMKDYLNSNIDSLIFHFISIDNRAFHNNQQNTDRAYWCYMGFEDLFFISLGAWGGTKEEVIEYAFVKNHIIDKLNNKGSQEFLALQKIVKDRIDTFNYMYNKE